MGKPDQDYVYQMTMMKLEDFGMNPSCCNLSNEERLFFQFISLCFRQPFCTELLPLLHWDGFVKPLSVVRLAHHGAFSNLCFLNELINI